MPDNPQSQAIALVNKLTDAAADLLALYDDVVQANQEWQDTGTANTLAAMSTVALKADGTPGTTDDVPNPDHPLNSAVYPNLKRTITANQVAALLTVLNNIPNYVNGVAVPTVGGVRAILSAEVG